MNDLNPICNAVVCVRTTSWGLFNTMARGAGLAGLFAYDIMVDYPILLPSLVTSGVMLLAALASLAVLESRNNLL